MSAPLLALLCLAVPSAPEYDRLEMYELAARAERVIAGTITAVQEKTFDLTVERDLLGGGIVGHLRLERFNDWTCAMRWDEYQAGQRVVLFLIGNRAMGAGDEGDWPIVDGQAFAPYRIHGLEQQKVAAGRRENRGTFVSLDELDQAIRGYRRCFVSSIERSDGRDRARVRFALDEQAALDYARTSTLARHLYEDTLSSASFVELDPHLLPPALDVEPLVRVRGESGLFATRMVTPGDLDGDGWDDLVVREAGLWVVQLDAGGNVLRKTAIDADTLGPDVYFGEGLTPIGDFDHDGVPDVAVSASPKEKNGTAGIGLLLLRRDGSLKRAVVLDAEGARGALGFGMSLSSIGDLDGNGVVDLLVDMDPSFVLQASLDGKGRRPHELVLLTLESTAAVSRMTSVPAADILGEGLSVAFARAMVQLGDLDGDGLPEMALGHPCGDDGGEFRGAVYIVTLERSGALHAQHEISDWSGGFDARLMDGDEFGEALAAPGDLDGDGIPDLIVSGARELWILYLQRDGTVRRFAQFGPRAGGFVAVDRILSLAVLRGSAGERRLAVGGRLGAPRMDPCLWFLKLDAGTLSKP